MQPLDRDTVRKDLMSILTDLRDDWEYSEEITLSTGIFKDLEFESIDAVALGSEIEDHFDQSLPFAEFLMKANERQAADITVGELVDFLMGNLHRSAERTS